MKLIDAVKLAGIILICQFAGGMGALANFESIPTWYAGLEKPWFTPPNWVFAPVWIILYTLMGVAAYLVLQKGAHRKDVQVALAVFAAQLVLNAAWSLLFFGFHAPLLAFLEIIMLWFAIGITIMRFRAISGSAGLLLVPYIAWVSFAAILNAAIWLLN